MEASKIPTSLSSSVNDKLSNDNLSDRKRKRLESKKKKAEAFLALVGHGSKTDSNSQLIRSSDTSLMSTTFSSEVQQVHRRKADDSSSSGHISSKVCGNNDTAQDETKEMDPVEEMKALLRERKKAIMQKPKVFLTPEDMVAFRAMPEEPISEEELPPLYVMDLQQLLLYGIQGNTASYKPRWCKILRVGRVASVVCLTVNGIGYEDYLQNKDNFPYLSENFDITVEIVTPEQYGQTLEQSLLNVPLSVSQLKKVNVRVPLHIQQVIREKLLPSTGKSKKVDETGKGKKVDEAGKSKKVDEAGKSKKVDEAGKKVDKAGKSKKVDEAGKSKKVDEVGKSEKGDEAGKSEKVDEAGKSEKVDEAENKETREDYTLPRPEKRIEKFTRKCLLLSTYQMMQEGYPLPIHTNKGSYEGFVFSKDKYENVRDESPIFAVDCEMCLTTAKKNELTRVSIVAEDGTLVYDTLVRPRRRITNYLTRYSGITKQMLEPVTTRIEDVQNKFKEVLPPDAILCGQSLNSDLMALQMFHPYVIDTSVIFNMSGNRRIKAGLRKLTHFFLGRSIQASMSGHCSHEDAMATLDLVKLKMSKGLEFGDATLSGIYFPDILTYFMGARGSGGQGRENVEREQPVESACDKTASVEQSTPGSKSAQEASESNCGGLKHKLSSQVQGSDSEPSTNGLGCSGSKISDKATPSGSSSGSSSSEDEETSTPKKKRKLDASESSTKAVESSSPQKTNSVTTSKSRENTDSGESSSSQKINSVTNNKSCENTDAGESEPPAQVSFSKVLREYLFNQCNSVHVPHSFFQLTREAGRTACVVGSADALRPYDSQPVEKLMVSSDSEVRRAAKQLVQKKGFVLAQFQGPSLANSESTESKHKMMRKLDRRLRSVYNKIPPNALVTIVFKGRCEEQKVNNIATFMKTT